MKAKLYQLDTWGNFKEGYEVNDSFLIDEKEVPEGISTKDLLAMFFIEPEIIYNEYGESCIEILKQGKGDRYLCPIFEIRL